MLSSVDCQDPSFDRDESTNDIDTICAIETLSLQIRPTDSGIVRKGSSRDPTLTKSCDSREKVGQRKKTTMTQHRNSAKGRTRCLSWLFTVWSPSGDSDQTTSTSAQSFA